MHPRYGRRLPLTREQGLLVARGAWFTPSLTVVVATLIHLLGEPRAIPFFISETDTGGLQGFVFTVGLTVSGVVQMAFAWHLYHELDAARPTAWFLASLLGLVAATNTVLVSHFDMYDHINPHIWTALLAFGGGLAWAFFAGWAMGPKATPAGRRLRRIGFSVAAVSFTVMMVAFQRAANRVDPTDLTTVEFLNQTQSGIVVAAPAEYALVAGLMICLASFRHELSAREEASSTAAPVREPVEP